MNLKDFKDLQESVPSPKQLKQIHEINNSDSNSNLAKPLSSEEIDFLLVNLNDNSDPRYVDEELPHRHSGEQYRDVFYDINISKECREVMLKRGDVHRYDGSEKNLDEVSGTSYSTNSHFKNSRLESKLKNKFRKASQFGKIRSFYLGVVSYLILFFLVILCFKLYFEGYFTGNDWNIAKATSVSNIDYRSTASIGGSPPLDGGGNESLLQIYSLQLKQKAQSLLQHGKQKFAFLTQNYANDNFEYSQVDFKHLRKNRAHLRAGPSLEYPVIYIYTRRNYPLKVIQEIDGWVQVKDFNGDRGWMYKPLLYRTNEVTIAPWDSLGSYEVYGDAEDKQEVVAKFEGGVNAYLIKCEAKSCLIKKHNYKGWVEARYLWGVDIIDELKQVVEISYNQDEKQPTIEEIIAGSSSKGGVYKGFSSAEEKQNDIIKLQKLDMLSLRLPSDK